MKISTIVMRIAAIMFVAEGFIMLGLAVLPEYPTLIEALIDSTLLTIVVAPMSYFLVIKPYHRAMSVKERDLMNSLSQSHEELRQYTSLMSHDMKSPLASVKGFTDSLQYSMAELRSLLSEIIPLLPESQRMAIAAEMEHNIPESLKFISGSVDRMDRLVSGVLKMAKLENLELSPEPVDVDELVDGVIDTMASQIATKKAMVTVGDLPKIDADWFALESILSNLISNAVKYLDPDRPGKIEVGCNDKDDRLEFFVKDNGIGVSAVDRNRIFEPFVRADVFGDEPGDGLGLSFAKRLAERMDGALRCASKPDVGSTFFLDLPKDVALGEA